MEEISTASLTDSVFGKINLTIKNLNAYIPSVIIIPPTSMKKLPNCIDNPK